MNDRGVYLFVKCQGADLVAPPDSDAFSTSLQHGFELFDDKTPDFVLMKLL